VGHDRDLASPIPWRRSLRAAHDRRVARMRRRRRVLRGRAGLTLAVAVSAIGAAGALAQDPTPPSGGTESVAPSSNRATVKAVQRALGLEADGVYGRKTRAAVRRFQRRHHLDVDGVLGPETLEELGLSGNDDDEDAPANGAPAAATGDASATLERIAQCESGGDPTAVSADGQYRGKYQFDRATWERLGGTGDPAAAPEAEQDSIAAKLLAERGTSPWPNCG
jgi:peptidoglycan hydrolase-like protein with peptidoglycan-binding domain